MAKTQVGEAQAAPKPPAAPVTARVVAVIVAGLLIGALTSVQKYLNSPRLSLVNAASPWLAPMFATGTLWPRLRGAALAGLATGLLELESLPS